MRLLLILVAIALPVPALCGQLHVQYFGLADVQKSNAVVYAGTFEGTKTKRARPKRKGARPQVSVTIRPTRAWGGDVAQAPTSFEIYGGVVWTNPRKSPIDRRLRGAQGSGTFKPGDTVVLVPSGGQYELLRGDEATLQKLDILYSPGGVEAYLKKANQSELERALADSDFGERAYKRLMSLGSLHAGPLVSAATSSAGRRILWDFFRDHSVSSQLKAKILTEAGATLQEQPKLLPQLVRSAVGGLDENTAGPLGAIAAKLSPAKREHQLAMSDLEIELRKFSREKRSPVTEPMAAFVLLYETHRPGHRSSHKYLDAFIESLSPRAKETFLLDLVTASQRSTHAGEDGVDQFLFYTALRSMEQEPSVVYLDPVAKLADPASVRTTSSRKSLTTRLVSLALGVAKNSRWRDAAQRFAEPYLRHGYDVDAGTLRAYRAAVGPEPSLSAEVERATLQRGRFEMLPSGYRVALSQDDELSLFSRHNRGKTLELSKDRTPYYEGVWEGRLYTVRPVSGGTEVAIYPKRPAEPSLLSETNLERTANSAAAAKGCARPTTRNFIRWEGVFLLHAQGPSNRCEVVVGAFTGEVADIRVKPGP